MSILAMWPLLLIFMAIIAVVAVAHVLIVATSFAKFLSALSEGEFPLYRYIPNIIGNAALELRKGMYPVSCRTKNGLYGEWRRAGKWRIWRGDVCLESHGEWPVD